MPHPPPATASPEADVDRKRRSMVEAAIGDFQALTPPDTSEWTFEMRHDLARRLVATTEWRAPAASVNLHIKAFSDDLETIRKISWFADLDDADVRWMRDEHLATSGELEQEHETRKRYWARSRQRVRLAVAVHYRRRRFYDRQPLVMHTRPRPRGAGRPRARATRSSARSGDSGEDALGDSDGNSPADRLAQLVALPDREWDAWWAALRQHVEHERAAAGVVA